MTWIGKLGKDEIPFNGVQEDILDAYFKKSQPGRICVSAGAGTGKTTLLVEIYSEIAIREFSKDPLNNPFQKLLAVTFTVEAAKQMKSKVRSRLREHFRKKKDEKGFNKIKRYLESSSWILTLDSLTRKLLSEVSIDAHIGPIGDVPDEYELSKVHEKIISDMGEDISIRSDVLLLSTAFPENFFQETGWSYLLQNGLKKARQYCMTSSQFADKAVETFEETIYQGLLSNISTIITNKDVQDISTNIGMMHPASMAATPGRVKNSHDLNRHILDSYCLLLKKYEEVYDDLTVKKGLMEHDDARFWVIKYANGDIKNSMHKKWADAQKTRFNHILVDEFQDTSHAQCRLLSFFIGSKTNLFIIGDPKQAIYQWRNADPEIFIKIIDQIKRGIQPISFLNADGFESFDLVDNYRSAPPLIEMFNEIFGGIASSLFKNPDYNGNYPIPCPDLVRKTKMPLAKKNSPIIHSMMDMKENDAKIIMSELRLIQIKKSKLLVRQNQGKNALWRKAQLGDCCILMQTRSPWLELRENLASNGIRYVMIAERGFFNRPEISLLIDILDWLGNPHNKDSLARILRSPIMGMSDSAIRYIASNDFDLVKSLDSIPKWMDKIDESKIIELIDLREDLRWMREGNKNEMIEKILRYSRIETILLSLFEGDQVYANIRYFQGIIASWEEDEILGYSIFIEKLKYFRENGTEQYNMAVLADQKDKGSVRIATVHAVKGLEFSIVFHLHTKADLDKQWQFNLDEKNLHVRDFGNFVSLSQIAPQATDQRDWETNFRPSTHIHPPYVGVFSPFAREIFAEKWRLFYVALTRAKDHIFFEIGSSRCFQDTGIMNTWADRLGLWYNKHSSDRSVSLSGVAKGTSKSRLSTKKISFDKIVYDKQFQLSDNFIPSSLNPSHIYDLIYCPRRYQYSVLQQVRGGPFQIEGKDPKFMDAIRFGTLLHRAMELCNFKEISENDEYENFLRMIKRGDPKIADRLSDSVNNFIHSQIFKDHILSAQDCIKELNAVQEIKNPSGKIAIVMKDKIDLLLKKTDGVILVDYKTDYPNGATVLDEFIRSHYLYQMIAYSKALEYQFDIKIKEALIFDYNTHSKEWKIIKLDTSTVSIENEIMKHMPLKVVIGGLEKIRRPEFCDNWCEFKEICNRNP